MTAPDLSVVVVTYRAADFVGACLRSLRADDIDIELIVVDNASPDDTLDVVRGSRPDARLVPMRSNLGFARAVNAGVAEASGRHVLLLNPDTVVLAGALATLTRAMDADGSIGVVAPRLLNSDGTDQGTARRFPTPAAAVFGRRSPLTRLFPRNRWSNRFLVGLQRGADRAPFEVDWVSGACLLSPTALFRQLGGMDEGFFMHFEDTDWCQRVKDAGLRVVCVPEAEVVHHEGGCRQGWPVSQVCHFHRGAYRYFSKHQLQGTRAALRPVAAGLLAARAAAVITNNGIQGRRVRRRPLTQAMGR